MGPPAGDVTNRRWGVVQQGKGEKEGQGGDTTGKGRDGGGGRSGELLEVALGILEVQSGEGDGR